MVKTLSGLLAVLGVMVGFLALGATESVQSREPVGEFLGGVSLDGHVHALATSRRQERLNGNSNDSGAIHVNSVQLGMTASPNEYVDATVVWLLEEGMGSSPAGQFSVDQAFVTIAGNERKLSGAKGRSHLSGSPWYVQMGKFYVPFGTSLEYHTFDVITVPQSLTLSETLESQLKFGYTPGRNLDVYAGVYSGSGPEQDDSQTIDDYYVGGDVRSPFGNLSLQWTNNLNNSLALSGTGGLNANEDAVGGVTIYGSSSFGPARLQVQHVRALDEYAQGSFNGDRPAATTAELTVSDLVEAGPHAMDLTLVYDLTEEWSNHPETTRGLVIDTRLLDGVTGSLEYVTRNYKSSQSNTLDGEQFVAVRLASEFSNLLGQ